MCFDASNYSLSKFKCIGLYWCVTALDLLGHVGELDQPAILQYVDSCMGEHGGFSAAPKHDAHLLYTLSAIQILITLKALQQKHVDAAVQFVKTLQLPDGICFFAALLALVHMLCALESPCSCCCSVLCNHQAAFRETSGARSTLDSHSAPSPHSSWLTGWTKYVAVNGASLCCNAPRRNIIMCMLLYLHLRLMSPRRWISSPDASTLMAASVAYQRQKHIQVWATELRSDCSSFYPNSCNRMASRSGLVLVFLSFASMLRVGQIYCCVSALALTGNIHRVDADLIGWWLSQRQLPSGIRSMHIYVCESAFAISLHPFVLTT
jgi:hypothetical protein